MGIEACVHARSGLCVDFKREGVTRVSEANALKTGPERRQIDNAPRVAGPWLAQLLPSPERRAVLITEFKTRSNYVFLFTG